MIIKGKFRVINRPDFIPEIRFLFFESPLSLPYPFLDDPDAAYLNWQLEHHFGVDSESGIAVFKDENDSCVWHFQMNDVRMWDGTDADSYLYYFKDAVFDRIQFEPVNDDDWWDEPEVEMLSLKAEVRDHSDACIFPAEALNGTWTCQYDYSNHEPEYGPSNPWDAPGMSIHDFI